MVRSVAVIGAGVIGGAISKCLVQSGKVEKVYATRRNIESLIPLANLGVNISDSNPAACREADVIFICVKPGDIEKVLVEIRGEVQDKLIVSTAAIVPLEFFESTAPGGKYVRTMPNVAAIVGESFTAYSMGSTTTLRDKAAVEELLGTMGTCMEVEEKYMDAITGLSGSGPAYIAIVIDALTYAGLRVGLPRGLSKLAAAQSVLGTAKMIVDGVMTPSEIEEMVTTPGGTTIEGIYEIEDGKLRTALMNAVQAATNKCINIRHIWDKAA
ncbi:pyrroline-5-carboxylate reductase [Candidatus Bathyarchaeota archaeon RBG_16_57_9]|nr:MAG: pyrroline-5-carboxylate reductase [Candidatus Bathyarchaeota archaeon RBG_16_57_9]